MFGFKSDRKKVLQCSDANVDTLDHQRRAQKLRTQQRRIVYTRMCPRGVDLPPLVWMNYSIGWKLRQHVWISGFSLSNLYLIPYMDPISNISK